LCAPVTEIVDREDIGSAYPDNVGEDVANDGGAKVACVEGFGNVRGAELHQHALSRRTCRCWWG